MRKRIVLRADGSSTIGFGHVYRLLAISEMLSPYFDCIFITREAPEILFEQIKSFCRDIILLPTENEKEEIDFVLKHINVEDIVVLDGYDFSEGYQKAIKNNGNKLVCIDDIAGKHFYADAVFNHAEGVEENIYDTESYTHLYLGVKYALLRQAFLEAAFTPSTFKEPICAFITFGGTDHFNLPLETLKACEEIEEIESIYLIMPGETINAKNIDDFIASSKKQVHTRVNATAEEMTGIMRQCSLAIVSASNITYELGCIKMSMVAVRFVDNQNNLARFLKKNNLAEVVQYNSTTIKNDISASVKKLLSDHQLIKEQIKNQQFFFDGRSAERVYSVFEKLSHD